MTVILGTVLINNMFFYPLWYRCHVYMYVQYLIVEVNKKLYLYLDANGSGHMAGRYINDGVISNRVVNARLCASGSVYTCKITGRTWVPVMATRTIKKGEEILLDYGPECTWKYPDASSSEDSPSGAGPADPESKDDPDLPPSNGDDHQHSDRKRKIPPEGRSPNSNKRTRNGGPSDSILDITEGTHLPHSQSKRPE